MRKVFHKESKQFYLIVFLKRKTYFCYSFLADAFSCKTFFPELHMQIGFPAWKRRASDDCFSCLHFAETDLILERG